MHPVAFSPVPVYSEAPPPRHCLLVPPPFASIIVSEIVPFSHRSIAPPCFSFSGLLPQRQMRAALGLEWVERSAPTPQGCRWASIEGRRPTRTKKSSHHSINLQPIQQSAHYGISFLSLSSVCPARGGAAPRSAPPRLIRRQGVAGQVSFQNLQPPCPSSARSITPQRQPLFVLI